MDDDLLQLSGFEFLGALCPQWNSCGHLAAVSSDRRTLRRRGVLKEKVSGCLMPTRENIFSSPILSPWM